MIMTFLALQTAQNIWRFGELDTIVSDDLDAALRSDEAGRPRQRSTAAGSGARTGSFPTALLFKSIWDGLVHDDVSFEPSTSCVGVVSPMNKTTGLNRGEVAFCLCQQVLNVRDKSVF
jgi:hypothetical protein